MKTVYKYMSEMMKIYITQFSKTTKIWELKNYAQKFFFFDSLPSPLVIDCYIDNGWQNPKGALESVIRKPLIYKKKH